MRKELASKHKLTTRKFNNQRKGYLRNINNVCKLSTIVVVFGYSTEHNEHGRMSV